MSTLKTLTERVRRRISEEEPSIYDKVQDPEIKHAIISACADALKLSMLSIHYNMEGGSVPDSSMIATYEDRAVLRSVNGYSRIELPTQPMMLPERQGVFSVYPSGRPDLAFMWVPPGMINTWMGTKLVNPINKIIFTAEQKHVEVYADLLGAGIPTVDMKLVVVDLNTIEDYDQLPISTDMEFTVINTVVKFFIDDPVKQDDGYKDAQRTKA